MLSHLTHHTYYLLRHRAAQCFPPPHLPHQARQDELQTRDYVCFLVHPSLYQRCRICGGVVCRVYSTGQEKIYLLRNERKNSCPWKIGYMLLDLICKRISLSFGLVKSLCKSLPVEYKLYLTWHGSSI